MPHSNKEEQLPSTSASIKQQYQETIDYLYSMLPMYQRVGKIAFKPDLSNTIKLCELLGNPHQKIKTIHVAGTNGKGSVSHILAAILQSAGYKTGLYTSPHYKDFRERIKVNGQPITEKAVIEFTHRIKKSIPELKPSFFEITVAMAFEYFEKQKTDINLIETGMGGRLDSTNIIDTELSIITNIELEHTQFLGDTIELIAFEKAGIIKKQKPVLTGKMKHHAFEVIEKQAKANNSPLYQATQICTINSREDINTFDLELSGEKPLHQLYPELKGIFQHENYQTAISAVPVLREKGFNISVDAIKSGIEHTRSLTDMLGRWQQIGLEPAIFLDGAHNAHALSAILKELNNYTYDKLHLVMGFVRDKDIEQMLSLMPIDATFYFAKPDVPRGLETEEILPVADKLGLTYFTYKNVHEAYTAARINALNQDFILVCGSIFTVGEIMP